MTKKRGSSSIYHESQKKARYGTHQQDAGGGYEIKARIDPVYGQQSAFPGLEDGPKDEENETKIFFGPAEDGLSYLQMVRAEASEVPTVLLAAKVDNTGQNFDTQQQQDYSTDQDMEQTGFWSGEAIVAKVMSNDASGVQYISDSDEGQDQGERDPQDVYYKALIARFAIIREILSGELRQPRDKHAEDGRTVSGVDPAPLISLTASQNSWYRAFSYSKPSVAFVSSLGQSSVIVALERLEILLTKRNMRDAQRQHNLGAWAWSLLARCRDVGQLSGEEISSLRSLAKSAMRLERKIRACHARSAGRTTDASITDDSDDDERNEDAEEDNGVTANESEDNKDSEIEEQLAEARNRLLDMVELDRRVNSKDVHVRLPEEVLPALMMLDSIVTVVGTLFGQRDLLGQRCAW